MKAIVYSEYGSPDVPLLREGKQPVPAHAEVLVKVCAASVNAADWRLMRAVPFLARLYKGLFRPKRITILGGQLFQAMLLGSLLSMFSKQKLCALSSVPNQKDPHLLKELLETDKLLPAIDSRYPLKQTPEAVRHIEQGHAKEKVVIWMQ